MNRFVLSLLLATVIAQEDGCVTEESPEYWNSTIEDFIEEKVPENEELVLSTDEEIITPIEVVVEMK